MTTPPEPDTFEEYLLGLDQKQCSRKHPDYANIADHVRQHLINMMSSVEQTDLQDLIGAALSGYDVAREFQR